jgi:hypothetical protein
VALNGDVLNLDEPLPGGALPLTTATTTDIAILDSSENGPRNATDYPLRWSGSIAHPPPPALAKRQYYIVSLTWKVQAREEEERQPGSELNLQWRPMVK